MSYIVFYKEKCKIAKKFSMSEDGEWDGEGVWVTIPALTP